jgi:hypothetical protein
MSSLLKKTFGGGSKKRRANDAGDLISPDYAKVSAREVIPTKLVDATFLSRTGLAGDFSMMDNHAGLGPFSWLRYDTNTSITHEFISTFEDNIREASGLPGF